MGNKKWEIGNGKLKMVKGRMSLKIILRSYLPFIFSLLILIDGCAKHEVQIERPSPPHGIKGVYHVVERHQTFYRICKTYGVDLKEVASLNGIMDPSKIQTGQRIFIPGAKKVSNEELLELKVDILIPAALENQITGKNAAKVKAKILAEAANGPTTLDADKILYRNGVFVIPDFLCNAGGVAGSYFEWVQNKQRHAAVYEYVRYNHRPHGGSPEGLQHSPDQPEQ
jgi:LysM repeat protein